jgi:hypothetical protein
MWHVGGTVSGKNAARFECQLMEGLASGPPCWNWLLPTVDVGALGGIAVAGGAVAATVDDARDRLDA